MSHGVGMAMLFAKELRGLRPYFLLVAVLFALSIGSELVGNFPDAMPLKPLVWLDEPRFGAVMVLVVVSVMTTAGLLVNEAEQGTLTFLDGLPVSRSRVFLAKVAGGLAVMFVAVLTVVLEMVGFGWLSRGFVDEPFPWGFVGVELLLLLAVSFYLFAMALVFSFFRRWLLLAIGLLAWSFLWLKTNQVPYGSLFDPFELARPGWDSALFRVPWNLLWLQLGTGIALLGVAWVGFCRLQRRNEGSRGGWRRVLVWAGWIGVPVVWVGVMMRLGGQIEESPSDVRKRHPGGEKQFGRVTTAHYEFIFREDQRRVAIRLEDSAEDVYATIAGLFPGVQSSGRVVVDLASRVASHVAAQAHWQKINLPLEQSPSLDEQRQMLGHELTHVFIELASDGRAKDRFQRTRWYHEGLATYYELRYFSTTNEIAANDRVAAAAHAWERVTFRDLCDDSVWGRRRAGELVYPLGRLWCEALVGVCGDGAPARIARALGHSSVLAATSSEGSWRTALRRADFDLETVSAAFDARLDSVVARHRKWIDSLPRLSASWSMNGSELELRPIWEGAAPGQLVARISPVQPDSSALFEFRLSPGSDGLVRISRSQCPGPTVWYALGWVVADAAFPVYESWNEKAIK